LAPTLAMLTRALRSLEPALRHVAPYQTVCNYGGIATRNIASSVSEGTSSGHWLRMEPLFAVDEMFAAREPAQDLHYNPYPHGAAPGQPSECEAGNEVYVPGRQIGNIPGDQGMRTEDTGPEDQ
jgi:hypothetical protein